MQHIQKHPEALSRQEWMRLFALAPQNSLHSFIAPFVGQVRWDYLRKPECGLIMAEGKTGQTRFNVGEVLVTRCAVCVQAEQNYQGHAYILGNNPKHAELAAVCDALMQIPRYAAKAKETLIPMLKGQQEELRGQRAAEVAPTKVDFFTMVRGEDA